MRARARADRWSAAAADRRQAAHQPDEHRRRRSPAATVEPSDDATASRDATTSLDRLSSLKHRQLARSTRRLVQCPPMVEPRVIPRAEHTISRRDIDPDALKVLYRLRQSDHIAYLVGGSVRDLLLGRRPKDFDIGTSAHPVPGQEAVPQLLDHRPPLPARAREVRHEGDRGGDVPPPGSARRGDRARTACPAPEPRSTRREARRTLHPSRQHVRHARRGRVPPRLHDQRALLRHRDLLDHRLRRRPGRSARRRRALDRRSGGALPGGSGAHAARRRARRAARLHDRSADPRGDPRSIATRSRESSPARLLEEYYKILRSGYAEKTFRGLAEAGLLEPISAELHHGAGEPLWRIARRARRVSAHGSRPPPRRFTNPVLLGSLLVPLGFTPRIAAARAAPPRAATHAAARNEGPRLGELPLARRDVERLGQMLRLQRRLRDVNASPRAQRALTHRSIFREALTWLEVHGDGPRSSSTGTAWPASTAPRLPPTRKHLAIGRHANAADAGAAGSGRRHLSQSLTFVSFADRSRCVVRTTSESERTTNDERWIFRTRSR